MEVTGMDLTTSRYLFKNDADSLIRNTLLYNIVFIILGMVVGVALAILITDVYSKKMKKLYQSVILLPFLISIDNCQLYRICFLKCREWNDQQQYYQTVQRNRYSMVFRTEILAVYPYFRKSVERMRVRYFNLYCGNTGIDRHCMRRQSLTVQADGSRLQTSHCRVWFRRLLRC